MYCTSRTGRFDDFEDALLMQRLHRLMNETEIKAKKAWKLFKAMARIKHRGGEREMFTETTY